MTLAVFLAPLALLLERFIGYPPALYAAIRHPVVWMGALIGLLDARLNHGTNRLGTGADTVESSITVNGNTPASPVRRPLARPQVGWFI